MQISLTGGSLTLGYGVQRKNYHNPNDDVDDVLSRKERRGESFHNFEDHNILGECV